MAPDGRQSPEFRRFAEQCEACRLDRRDHRDGKHKEILNDVPGGIFGGFVLPYIMMGDMTWMKIF